MVVYCVNDGAVMKAWGAEQGVEGSMVTLMGDPAGDLTRALNMEMVHPGPYSVGIRGRCKRFALYIVNGQVKAVRVSEAEDDPAGDDNPNDTCAPALIDVIKNLGGGSGEL